jgi:hypothetical protein
MAHKKEEKKGTGPHKPAFDPAYPKHTPPDHGHSEDEEPDEDPGKDDPWNKPKPAPDGPQTQDDTGGNPSTPPPGHP